MVTGTTGQGIQADTGKSKETDPPSKSRQKLHSSANLDFSPVECILDF